MQDNQSRKYTDIFTFIGYVIGFLCILWYFIFGGNPFLPVIGVIIIFIGRFVGYGIDRIIDLKENNKVIDSLMVYHSFYVLFFS